ncbi:MAG: glyoxalase [Micromonosporaceae bacterium]|nr:glyoxalase [Micromonosporaceae bacterium]
MNPTMNTIDIVVSDLDAAIAFYSRLGLDFKVDAHMPGHAGCDLPHGLHLMLDTEELRGEMVPGWSRPSGGPRAFFAFEFPSPSEVDAAYQELTEAGHQGLTAPFDAFWGMRHATVVDPDGNGVDLYATLPAS